MIALTQNKMDSTSVTLRTGTLPDGVKLDEIILFAKHAEITRFAILADLAGYTMIDRRADGNRPSYDAAIFRKN